MVYTTHTQVADTVELGRATLGKIKQNLFWALSYNCVSIPLAAGVLLPSYSVALTPSIAGGDDGRQLHRRGVQLAAAQAAPPLRLDQRRGPA